MKKETKQKIKAYIRGIASVFDIYGSLYSSVEIKSDRESFEEDARMLKGDWYAVGGDLEKAINKLREEIR